MLADLIAALVPEPVICMGVSLRPWSLGHMILCNQFAPSVVGASGDSVSIPDFIAGLFICSRTFEEGYSGFCDGRAVEWSRKFGRTVKKRGRPNWLKEIAFFHGYIGDGMKEPGYYVKESSGPGTVQRGASYWEQVRFILATEFHLSNSEIMNRPLRLTRQDIAIWSDWNGCARMKCESDFERQRQVQAQAEQLQRELARRQAKGGHHA